MIKRYWGIWFHGDPKATDAANRPGLCGGLDFDGVGGTLYARKVDAQAEMENFAHGQTDKYSLARVTVEVLS